MPSTAKLVLLCLAERAGRGTDICWPSIECLMTDTCLSRSSVFRWLAWLEEHDHIERVPVRGKDIGYKVLMFDKRQSTIRTEESATETDESVIRTDSPYISSEPSLNRNRTLRVTAQSEPSDMTKVRDVIPETMKPKSPEELLASCKPGPDGHYGVAKLANLWSGLMSYHYHGKGYMFGLTVVERKTLGALVEKLEEHTTGLGLRIIAMVARDWEAYGRQVEITENVRRAPDRPSVFFLNQHLDTAISVLNTTQTPQSAPPQKPAKVQLIAEFKPVAEDDSPAEITFDTI